VAYEDRGSKPAWANSPQEPISKNNQSKMDWICGSSSTAPALQVQSPEFKSKYHKEKQTNKKL
jgi:hypothetical protein